MVALLGGVELGGTKTVVLIARGTEVIEQRRIPTTTPLETLTAASDALAEWTHRHGAVAAIGIGSFGPLGLNGVAQGCITGTPKPGWAGTDVVGHFASQFAVPIAFDTDVAAAALAEGRWGASIGARVHVYVTIGTGIGAGVVVDGHAVHGLVHPEIGHVRVRRVAGDSFAGNCPFHGDCLEGLASGPAIAARAGRAAPDLPPDHPVWSSVATEIAELAAMLILTISAERIVFGGGVMAGQPHLLAMVRARTDELLGGYVAGVDGVTLGSIIVPPQLGVMAGPFGTIALAELVLA